MLWLRPGDWGVKIGLFGSEKGDLGEQWCFWGVQWWFCAFKMGICVLKGGFGQRNGNCCGPKTGFQGLNGDSWFQAVISG